MQPNRQLLPDLTEITPQCLGLIPVPWCLIRLIEREPRFAGNGELLERAVDQRLLGRPRVHVGLHFRQAVGEEQDAVDHHAVGGALDLEVAEEGVGAEQAEDFVEAVVRFAVWVDVDGIEVRWESGERVGWATGLGAQREEGEVAWSFEVSEENIWRSGHAMGCIYLLIARPGRPGRLSGMPVGLGCQRRMNIWEGCRGLVAYWHLDFDLGVDATEGTNRKRMSVVWSSPSHSHYFK